ncbi:MAG: linear amide C-N hydrolase [Candidatus Krumholzibacteria bacterium]|nr:linear amide C-N hydrolase [Candidatus Krumholzibacteria bacterium]
MKRIRVLALGAALVSSLLFLGTPAADACSSFLMRNGTQLLFGRNFDFFLDGGYVMTNQSGVAKQALIPNSPKPARWISKYGSITFNQVSKEYPYGGMNEAGLVVENMWLDSSTFPVPDERAPIAELPWIQYQLDNCATVDEVIATDGIIRIIQASPPIHFFVADRAGDAATIEFVDGRTVVHRGADLAVPALANNTYDESMEYLRGHKGFGGSKEIKSTWESLDRFATLASMIEDRGVVRRGKEVDCAFKMLDAVAQGKGTVWSAVYDLKRLRIHFKSVGNGDVRIVDLDGFDFSCAAPALVFDIEAPAKGDITGRFESYTTELNRGTVKRTFARYHENNFMMGVTDEMQEYLAQFPAMLKCGQ